MNADTSTHAADRAAAAARLLRRAERPGTRAASRAIPVLPPGAAVPPSFGQERMLLTERRIPDSGAGNTVYVWRLKGRLDGSALAYAVTAVTERHDVLRTHFDADGAPRVRPAAPVDLTAADLSSLPDPGAELESRARCALARPPRLTEAPPVEWTLCTLGADDHALLLWIHHIATDGWSEAVIQSDLSAFYNARRAGQAAPLKDLAVRYGDYAHWQRSRATEEAVTWWTDRLRETPHLLSLPVDRRPSEEETDNCSSLEHLLPPQTADAARRFAQAGSASLFMVLLSALGVLLQRTSRQDRFIVGTPVAGRAEPELHDLVGFFVNTLALPIDLSGTPTFRTLVARVRDTALEAFGRQDAPLERVVEQLRPQREFGREPLVQLLFQLHTPEDVPLRLDGLDVTRRQYFPTAMALDLSVTMAETEHGLGGVWQYRTDLFDEATVARLQDQYAVVLAGLLAAPDRPIAQISLLGATERDRILYDWNQTAVEGTAPSLVELFETQVARVPDEAAVIGAEGRLSYTELDTRANRLAAHLRSLGVGPERVVGVHFQRGFDLITTVLAILKTGGAYLPLDPRQPGTRVAAMVRDGRPDLVVTAGDLRGPLPECACPVLDFDPAVWPAAPATGVSPRPDPDTLAYVLFTSGSTGRPKGVGVTHSGLANFLRWSSRTFESGGKHGSLLHSPITFDFTVTPLFGPLIQGRSLILLDEEDPVGALAEALVRPDLDLDVVKLTPSHLDALRMRLPADARITSVRTFVLGGEQLTGEAVRAWRSLAPAARFLNEYGPTETVVGCVCHHTDGSEPADRPIPIGRPVDNTQAYVLDAALNPVPVGTVGWLHVAGAGVARGYVGRPGLSAERFLPDPFGAVPGGRMYATGDQVRWRADGVLEYLGRNDGQVKVRGHRVELSEVHSVLLTHPAVGEAVVSVQGGGPTARLVAHWVAESGAQAPDSADLRRFLAGLLPDYMIPGAFVTLDALPLTPHGKVDHDALPEPVEPADSGTRREPATAEERTMAGIWQDVLGAAAIGPDDDFFQLGGHSLLANQIVARVQAAFPAARGRKLMRDLFAFPTLADFAALVAGDPDPRAVPAATPRPIRPAARGADGSIPLSRFQEQLWFLDQLDRHGQEFLVPVVRRITGPLDVRALDAALREVVRRHEVLRTRFATGADRPHGRPADPAEFAVEMPTPNPEQITAAGGAAQYVLAAACQPLDLANGLPVRAVLLQTGTAEAYLGLTFHHIAFDGFSHQVFWDELAAAYAATSQGVAVDLPDLPFQYADVALWQDDLLDAEGVEHELAYWRRTLAEATATEVPPDRPRPARRSGRGDTVERLVPDPVVRSLEKIARRHGATPFIALLGACQAILGRVVGTDDVLLGTNVALRSDAATEGLIGPFLNTLALRGDISGDPTFGALLTRTRETVADAFDHSRISFDQVVSALGPAPDLSRSPVFQILVNYQVADGPPPALAGLDLTEVPIPDPISKYDLDFEFFRTGDGLRCLIEYDSVLYDRETADRLLDLLVRYLTAVAADPEVELNRVPLVDEAGAREIIALGAGTVRAIPDTTLHELFSAQAARTPEAIALSADSGDVTYRELEDWSDLVAAHLIDTGVRPDAVVGVRLARGPEMIAAILGVLKAGGAFLPIETETPPSRVAALLADSHAPVCLVSDVSHDSEMWAGLNGCHPLPVPAPGTGGAGTVPLRRRTDPAQLAAVYYTSGSTGRAKGVACPHRGWVNRMRWMQERHGLQPGETVLHKTTLTFDDAAVEIFWPLMIGGTVALLPPGLHRDPQSILDAAKRHRAVHLQFVPSMLDLFLDGVAQGDQSGLEPLRSVLSSGEALRPALVAKFRTVFGDRVSLDNTWGATEVSIDSTFHVCAARDAAADTRSVCIGRAMDNNEIFVLDRDLQVVPIGGSGELFIGGDGLARGYLRDPRRTAQSFIPHPFRTGERLYRTGDWGRMRPDGSFVFLDRRDDQVKVRGVRIELGEVTAALTALPAVADGAVIAWEAAPGDKRLAAYAVPRQGFSTTPTELLAELRSVLPTYCVPGSLAIMDALPRLASGKLDRQGLPAPRPDSEPDTSYLAPRTPLESALAEIWADVLGVPHIGVDDDFFARGGHSLLATRIISRMRAAFPIEVPLSLIFEEPTVARTAAALEAAIVAHVAATVPADPPAAARGTDPGKDTQ
jgi:amino acid adenylation domain-containing protein